MREKSNYNCGPIQFQNMQKISEFVGEQSHDEFEIQIDEKNIL